MTLNSGLNGVGAIAAAGDVDGPGVSVVNNRLAVWSGTSGTDIKDPGDATWDGSLLNVGGTGQAKVGTAQGIWLGNAGTALAFNRNPSSGAIDDATAHAFQWQHNSNASEALDVLTLNTYLPSGALRRNALIISGRGWIGIGALDPGEDLIFDGSGISYGSNASLIHTRTKTDFAIHTIEGALGVFVEFILRGNPADTRRIRQTLTGQVYSHLVLNDDNTIKHADPLSISLVSGFVGIGTSNQQQKFSVVTGTTTLSGFHLGELDDTGGYLASTLDSEMAISGGWQRDGATQYRARATEASLIEMVAGEVRFFTATGLTVGVTAAPPLRMTLTNTALSLNVPALVPDGTVALPAMAFANSPGTGFSFLVASSRFSMSILGIERQRLTPGGLFVNFTASSTTPHYSSLIASSTGIGFPGGASLSVITGNTEAVQWTAAQVMQVADNIEIQEGKRIVFDADKDTFLSSVTDDQLRWTVGNVNMLEFFSTAIVADVVVISRRNFIGSAQTEALMARNSAVATASVAQFSPTIEWEGRGWKTDATAASQRLNFLSQLETTVTGTSQIEGDLVFSKKINGSGLTVIGRLSSKGQWKLPGGSIPYSFIGDEDTGVDSLSADQLSLLAGGAEIVLLTTSSVVLNQSTEIVDVPPGTIGGFPAGQLMVRNTGTLANDNSVITGHNSFNGNTQLWYLGSGSSSNQDIVFLNRQNASLSLGTNSTVAIAIEQDQTVLFSSDVTIAGNLVVKGTTTQLSSETVNLADNHMYLNAGYTTAVAQTGGIITNFLPTATVDTVVTGAFVAGVPATSNPTVATVGAATFAIGAIIQFSNSNGNENDGVFEVLSHAANLLTIRGIGLTSTVEDWTGNQFVANASDSATITQVNVSVMRAGTDGAWETASGLTTGFTFSDLVTTAAPTELTIAAGIITKTGPFHRVDTESDASTDNLDTINGGSSGDRVVLRAANGLRTVIVKDTVGNLRLQGDFTMDNGEDTIELIFDVGVWLELSRSNNAP